VRRAASGAGRRWAVVVALVGVLVALPPVIGALPASDADVSATELRDAALASAEQPFSGYAESAGGLTLPVGSPRFSSVVDLFSDRTQMRVWWRGDTESRVDVVTARSEAYEAPAALPTVEPGSIRDDLFRRDFTINAIAISLKPEDLGRLVDPFEGRRDLEAQTVRVLHDRSFADDPTRILRAVRYESRYGFRMDEHTLALAEDAVVRGLVGELSGARLREELVVLLEEEERERSLLRLAELGLDRALHPRLAADDEAVALLGRLAALRDRYRLPVPSWRLGLAALARRLAPDDAREWLAGLKLRRRDADAIAAAVSAGPELAERLREAIDPAEIVSLADRYPADAPLFALGLADLPQLRAYFERLRDVRLEVDGADLARLGLEESPRVGEVLAELRRRKLNGELDGRDSELAAARELIAS